VQHDQQRIVDAPAAHQHELLEPADAQEAGLGHRPGEHRALRIPERGRAPGLPEHRLLRRNSIRLFG
jgi:hypothetical protein